MMKPLNEEQDDDHSKSFSRISGSNSQLNDFYKSFASNSCNSSSSQSIGNITSLNYFPMKLTYILITILNTSLGFISLLKHYPSFIRQEVYHILIYLFLFTFQWPIVLFLGLVISGLIIFTKKLILFFKNKNKLEESDHEETDEHVYYNEAGMYDKTKNLSKIKNNLFNLQGNVLNYYNNFNDNMKKIEKSNKDHYVINKEVREKIGRPGSSSAKLGRSKLNK